MIHHSTNRNRSKGFKIKRIVQVALLLGVALWLVYQIKNSYDNDQKKLSTGVGDLYLGRKGNPVTEKSVSVDSDGSDTAEQNEQKDGDNDTNRHVGVNTKEAISFTDADPDVNTEEEVSNKGSQEPQEDSSLNGEKQILQEKHVDNVDDDSNDKSNDDETRKDKVEGKEVLQLPSQMDDDHSSGKVEDDTGGTNSNGPTKIIPGSQIEQSSDPSENVSEHGNNAISESGEESSNAIRSQEGAENVNSVSDEQDNASSTEDEVTNDSKQESENANSVSDVQNNASPTKDEVTNDSKPDAENVNSVSDLQKNAEVGVSDKQNTDNQTAEVGNTDNTKSEDDVDASKPNPENNRVMPTNYEASIKDSFETQGDNAQAETTDNNSSEETKAGRPDEDSSSDAQNNSEVLVTEKTEAMNSNPQYGGDEDNAKENKIPESEAKTKSVPEDSISSQTANGDANTEMEDSGDVESQLSSSNGLSTANSNTETMQEGGGSASSSSSSLPEISQPAKLKTRKATLKNRKKQRHHKQKE